MRIHCLQGVSHNKDEREIRRIQGLGKKQGRESLRHRAVEESRESN